MKIFLVLFAIYMIYVSAKIFFVPELKTKENREKMFYKMKRSFSYYESTAMLGYLISSVFYVLTGTFIGTLPFVLMAVLVIAYNGFILRYSLKWVEKNDTFKDSNVFTRLFHKLWVLLEILYCVYFILTVFGVIL